jgi:hypothetical protein
MGAPLATLEASYCGTVSTESKQGDKHMQQATVKAYLDPNREKAVDKHKNQLRRKVLPHSGASNARGPLGQSACQNGDTNKNTQGSGASTRCKQTWGKVIPGTWGQTALGAAHLQEDNRRNFHNNRRDYTSQPSRSQNPQPQGTLPMVQDGAQDNDDSLVLSNLKLDTDGGSKAKSDPKEDSEDDLGSVDAEDDSIAKAIAGTRKQRIPGGKDSQEGKSRKTKGWKPIPKVTSTLGGSQPSPQEEAQSSAKKGAKFVEGTQFHEKTVFTARKTPGKESKMQDSSIHVRLKLLHGQKDVPESVMGMINHVLMSIMNKIRRPTSSIARNLLKCPKPQTSPRISRISMTSGEYGMNA